ncbi:MAG: tetratricopeptide repeat protein [Clostridiales bacterium]|jgi:tetratricopeptide (TPR) repeat protein|nr:tetratricopeptide repeat protein [Clostridiales bacterium]
MAGGLILCVSQKRRDEPYLFKATNIKVYSMEEAAYHCYRYWNQSLDDFTSEPFIAWTRDVLGLSDISAELMKIAGGSGDVKEKLMSFLGMFYDANDARLSALSASVAEWSKRLEWEKLKEQADYFVKNKKPVRALELYKKALKLCENVKLLNNAAVALMSIGGRFQEALAFLKRALEIEPRNPKALLNVAEVSIMSGESEAAAEALDALSPESADALFLRGELKARAGEMNAAISYFERAAALKPSARLFYRMAESYCSIKAFEKAFAALARVERRDSEYYIKFADVKREAEGKQAAIESVKRAVEDENLPPEEQSYLCAELASRYRLSGDRKKAAAAAELALSVHETARALLERARAEKDMGNFKLYQLFLKKAIDACKLKVMNEELTLRG